MPEDRVTITADASQYFDVLSRAGTAANRLAVGGERIGTSFLKGERATETATRAITAGLLTAGDAATSATIIIDGLARALRLPLFAGATGAAGAVFITRIVQESKAASAAAVVLANDLATIGKGAGPEKIVSQIQRVTAELTDAAAKAEALGNKIANFFDRTINPLLGTTSRGTGAQQQATIAAGARLLAELSERRVFAAAAQRDIQREILQGHEDQAAIDKVILDTGEKVADIESESKKRRLELFDLTRRGLLSPAQRDSLLQAEIRSANELKQITKETGDIAIANIEKSIALRRRESAIAAQTQLGGEQRSFLRDVGSGQFVRDFFSNQLAAMQEARGRQIVAQLTEFDRLHPGRLGPIERAIVDAAKKGFGQGDFTGLAALDGLKWEGLRALNNLVITIQ